MLAFQVVNDAQLSTIATRFAAQAHTYIRLLAETNKDWNYPATDSDTVQLAYLAYP